MDITAFVNNVSGLYKLPRDECTIISAHFQQPNFFTKEAHRNLAAEDLGQQELTLQ